MITTATYKGKKIIKFSRKEGVNVGRLRFKTLEAATAFIDTL